MRCAVSGRLLLFCADTELLHLYNSEFIIATAPSRWPVIHHTEFILSTATYMVKLLHWTGPFFQVVQSYTDMFGALTDAFICTFGDVGHRTFLMDYESAAINAILATFPASSVKGFTFHFRQAITRRVQCKSSV